MANQYYDPQSPFQRAPDLETPEQPVYQQPAYQPEQNLYPQQSYQQTSYRQPAGPQPNLLVYGILSLVFECVVAIILGSIGRRKGNEYVAAGGTLTGTAKVGYILCKVGVILGIISTIIVGLYLLLIIAGIASGMG